jgi:DnaA family protein
VPGANGAALAALRDVLAGRGPAFVHLWGLPGSGRSHLLAAVRAAAAGAPAADAPDAGAVPRFALPRRVYVADDVQQLDSDGQARLFGLQNEIRQHPGCFLVTTADLPPAHLGLREDVRSRLAWGLVFALQPIAEPDQAAALIAYARSRGARVDDELVPYMLTRLPRDMRTLVSVLDALDALALARQRALTVPLLREWLQQEGQASNFAEDGKISPIQRQLNLPMKLPLRAAAVPPAASPAESSSDRSDDAAGDPPRDPKTGPAAPGQ